LRDKTNVLALRFFSRADKMSVNYFTCHLSLHLRKKNPIVYALLFTPPFRVFVLLEMVYIFCGPYTLNAYFGVWDLKFFLSGKALFELVVII